MCGLLGSVSTIPVDVGKWQAASHMQIHRGPDDQNDWRTKAGSWHIALGHQRLSIIDLSSMGSQPMLNEDDSSVIAYNGEIYNYLELKRQLQSHGVVFSGNSDTEVLIKALTHWGIENALPRLNGMWAFAWYEPVKKRLWLSRDRFGEKPLYWTKDETGIYFASELKTLLELTGREYELNPQVVGEYLQQSLLNTSTDTFFKNIYQVPQSSILTIDLESSRLDVKTVRYWHCPVTGVECNSEQEFNEQLQEVFLDSVKLRLRSDVPVGVLLSGGLDSSSIAAAVQHANGAGSELNLLSAVSDDPRFDESPYIDTVARYLGQPVHKVRLPLNSGNLFTQLEEATWYADVPLGSFSNVAHYLLMKQAKDAGITVILSGQGADELLCGYRKYLGFHIQSQIRAGRYVAGFRTLWDFWRQGTVLKQFSWAESKRYLPGWLKTNDARILGEYLDAYQLAGVGLAPGMTLQERQRADLERFSVPVLNHFEDRMSMSQSREIRLPFLDHRLVEMLVPAKAERKLNQGWTKYSFRRAMEPFLPAEITWRKDKQGFINPEAEWLKNELGKEVRERFFHPDALIFRAGLIQRPALLQHFNNYCHQPSGRKSIWFKEIFNPLAMEVWMRTFQKYIVGV